MANPKLTGQICGYFSEILYRGIVEVKILFLVLLLLHLLLGCIGNVSNNDAATLVVNGIQVRVPANWEIPKDARVSNRVIIKSNTGILEKESTQIILYTSHAGSGKITSKEFATTIHRIGSLYNVDSVKFVEEPNDMSNDEFQIFRAIIAVPVTSTTGQLSDGQNANNDEKYLAEIYLYKIRNDLGGQIDAEVYMADSESLKSQALEIIESIRFQSSFK